MRLFCVKMRRRDWFRMGHSDWLLGSGRFGPLRVVWSGSDQVEVTWLWQWWLSCAENRNPVVWVNLIFGDDKMADNRRGFAILNKNRVVVFIKTMIGGHTGRALHRECMSVLCCGCFVEASVMGPVWAPTWLHTFRQYTNDVYSGLPGNPGAVVSGEWTI